MARYLQVAAEANVLAKVLLEIVPEPNRPQAAEMIARLVNFGIRCNPRPAMSTVRLRAVQAAVRGLPVEVSMMEKRDEKTNKKYNVLVTKPVGGQESVEGGYDED